MILNLASSATARTPPSQPGEQTRECSYTAAIALTMRRRWRMFWPMKLAYGHLRRILAPLVPPPRPPSSAGRPLRHQRIAKFPLGGVAYARPR